MRIPREYNFWYFMESHTPGSHYGNHTVRCALFAMARVPQEVQSSLGNMFSALMFHSKDRSTYGSKATFRPLIEET